MAKKVADQIVAQLEAAGVKRIYGIVGDSLNPVVDAVRRSKQIQWIHTRNEEAAAFAAGADAQLTGELAVCAGSCGPGNLHLINGLYDAHRSHARVLAIASHIPSTQIGLGYFQETHPDRLFVECSNYCELISSAAQSRRVVGSAIQHANVLEGVAVVILPGDVADAEAAGGDAPGFATVSKPVVTAPEADLKSVAGAIDKASKVLIFAGAGVEGAHDEVVELGKKLGAPIGHSLRGKMFIQYDNPLDVGMTGLLGYGAVHSALQECDLLILVGTDFPYDQFLRQDVITVQIDHHGEVIGRRTQVDYPIVGDVAPTVARLTELVAQKSDKFGRKMVAKHEDMVHKTVGAYTRDVEKHTPIHPEYVASILDEVAADDAVFTADTGMCNVWTARYITPNGRRKLIGSLLHGSMANALPQSIGAQFAYPGRQVVSVSGDGGLSMLLGEMVTLATYQLPVKLVVFNNSTLGMVKLEMLVDGLPDYGVDVPPTSYAKIGEALGFHAERVEDPKEVRGALSSAFAAKGPAIVEVVTDPWAMSVPPQIKGDMIKNFSLAMTKIVMNQGVGEAVTIARSNLRNIPRP